ncbi:alpha/beta hydrolase family protein [Candidatus Leptofilum sp.]|uniref:alpha/beta hydrolase family protein n=1 Tax=Candidatus Leptofilum sp. TaxID=3241576 RepID=UPI003B5C7B27
MKIKPFFIVIVALVGLLVLVGMQSNVAASEAMADQAVEQARVPDLEPPAIQSLRQLSIDGLRGRTFRSSITIEEQLGDDTGSSEYSQFFGAPYYNTYMASYRSDGLNVYSRVDIPPTEMPEDGYPVIVFAHGWVGANGAPGYTFNYGANSYYGDMLDAYVKAGYVLLMPGFRGHGTVNGVPADGIEYMHAYDNGSYLSTMFYAIDILNLLGGVDSLNHTDWAAWGAGDVQIDTSRIYLTAHSQGGDAAFTAFTVSSSPKLDNHFAAASLWASSIEGRIEQGAFLGPQEWSADAWTDPAYFPHMPSWWDPAWSTATIEDGLANRKNTMYDTVNTYVADQGDADPDTNSLVEIMATLDAAKHTQYITAPLDLHYSDMDHYSIPEWNEGIMRKLRMMGGSGNTYLYAGNSHEFRVIDGWSPAGSIPGRDMAIERTIALFDATQ